MLEVLGRLFSTVIISLSVFYVISKIIYLKLVKINIKQIMLWVAITMISCLLYPINYSGVYTIIIFFLYVLFYKLIFNLKIEEALISCGLMMIILFFADILTSLIFMWNFAVDEIRTNPLILIATNTTVGLISISVVSVPCIINQLNKFYNRHGLYAVSIVVFLLEILTFITYILSLTFF